MKIRAYLKNNETWSQVLAENIAFLEQPSN